MPAQLLQQVVARQHGAGVTGQQPEQVELGRGQVDDLIAQVRAARCLADVEAAKGQLLLRFIGTKAVAKPCWQPPELSAIVL